MRVQRATGSLAGWQREETWVHELRPGCRSQKLGNCSFNESRVSPSPEAKLLRKSKSLPGTAAMQAACSPHELCSLCCGEVPYDLFPAQQDTSRRFRAAGHSDPILSPGTNHQKPDWCSAGSRHRASNLLQPLPPQGWAPLFAGQCQRGWAGDNPAATLRETGCSAAQLGLLVSPLPKQGSPPAELDTERGIPAQLRGFL